MTTLEEFKGSRNIRKLIVEQSQKHGLPLRYICHHLKINYKDFINSFLNSNNGAECKITEEEFRKILELLGVEVRHQWLVNENYDPSELIKELTEKYA